MIAARYFGATPGNQYTLERANNTAINSPAGLLRFASCDNVPFDEEYDMVGGLNTSFALAVLGYRTVAFLSSNHKYFVVAMFSCLTLDSLNEKARLSHLASVALTTVWQFRNLRVCVNPHAERSRQVSPIFQFFRLAISVVR